jgi:hypothetical protein
MAEISLFDLDIERIILYYYYCMYNQPMTTKMFLQGPIPMIESLKSNFL